MVSASSWCQERFVSVHRNMSVGENEPVMRYFSTVGVVQVSSR